MLFLLIIAGSFMVTGLDVKIIDDELSYFLSYNNFSYKTKDNVSIYHTEYDNPQIKL